MTSRNHLYPVLLCLVLLLPLGARAAATDVAGVPLADHYSVDGTSLVLNGAGIRSKFFIHIYVGALYLPETSKSAASILAAPGPYSMQMYMLYKRVDADKIRNGWTEGFRANVDGDGFAALEDRLRQFNRLFTDLKKGDVVRMDYAPGKGTSIRINGQPRGTVPGRDFALALLRVWIGEHPADDDLKRGLLGG